LNTKTCQLHNNLSNVCHLVPLLLCNMYAMNNEAISFVTRFEYAVVQGVPDHCEFRINPMFFAKNCLMLTKC